MEIHVHAFHDTGQYMDFLMDLDFGIAYMYAAPEARARLNGVRVAWVMGRYVIPGFDGTYEQMDIANDWLARDLANINDDLVVESKYLQAFIQRVKDRKYNLV